MAPLLSFLKFQPRILWVSHLGFVNHVMFFYIHTLGFLLSDIESFIFRFRFCYSHRFSQAKCLFSSNEGVFLDLSILLFETLVPSDLGFSQIKRFNFQIFEFSVFTFWVFKFYTTCFYIPFEFWFTVLLFSLGVGQTNGFSFLDFEFFVSGLGFVRA